MGGVAVEEGAEKWMEERETEMTSVKVRTRDGSGRGSKRKEEFLLWEI